MTFPFVTAAAAVVMATAATTAAAAAASSAGSCWGGRRGLSARPSAVERMWLVSLLLLIIAQKGRFEEGLNVFIADIFLCFPSKFNWSYSQ